MKPKICILRSDGTNCDYELFYAFEKAGGISEMVHVNQLRNRKKTLASFDILALPGGFSYGDDVASGKILAVELISFFKKELQTFVDKGGIVLGVCNGFQTLIRTGLLPFNKLGTMQVTLTNNDSGHFECRFVKIKPEKSKAKMFSSLTNIMDVAVNHGEGKIYTDPKTLKKMEDEKLIIFRYVDDNGKPTQDYPQNPNGSMNAIAGLCDPTGRIIGLMPHPEKFIEITQHPNWRKNKFRKPHGLPFFESIISFAKMNKL